MPYRKSINPKSWGPPAWSFLDSVVAGYPMSAKVPEQLAVANFMYSLEKTLPCERCRGNYKQFIDTNPPELHVAGKKSLGVWFKALKKHINQ